MSRVGKEPILIPSGVKLQLNGNALNIEGPKGKKEMKIHHRIKVSVSDKEVLVERSTNNKLDRSLHGTTRSNINNHIIGVTEGFKKELEIQGVGFKAQSKGKTVNLALGFSHPVDFPVPEGIEVKTPKPTIIEVTGFDKYLVGQVASDLRRLYPPEPYKGKGVRYKGEVIKRKQGKSVG